MGCFSIGSCSSKISMFVFQLCFSSFSFQICLWGHPTSTGLAHMDYFLSSDLFHKDQEHYLLSQAHGGFSEQLLRLDSPGFSFIRSNLSCLSVMLNSDNNITSILTTRGEKFIATIENSFKVDRDSLGLAQLTALFSRMQNEKIKLVLCPQHLPKFHPKFDTVLREILSSVSSALLVLVHSSSTKTPWRLTLEKRWKNTLGQSLMSRIVWLDSLSPSQYLSLLAVGDIMIGNASIINFNIFQNRFILQILFHLEVE